MLASVELKKRENRDDIDFFLQMNGYVPCGIISIWVYLFTRNKYLWLLVLGLTTKKGSIEVKH